MKMTIENVNTNVNVYVDVQARELNDAIDILKTTCHLHDDEFVMIHREEGHDDDECGSFLFACHADVADGDLYNDTMHDMYSCMTHYVNAPYEMI